MPCEAVLRLEAKNTRMPSVWCQSTSDHQRGSERRRVRLQSLSFDDSTCCCRHGDIGRQQRQRSHQVPLRHRIYAAATVCGVVLPRGRTRQPPMGGPASSRLLAVCGAVCPGVAVSLVYNGAGSLPARPPSSTPTSNRGRCCFAAALFCRVACAAAHWQTPLLGRTAALALGHLLRSAGSATAHPVVRAVGWCSPPLSRVTMGCRFSCYGNSDGVYALPRTSTALAAVTESDSHPAQTSVTAGAFFPGDTPGFVDDWLPCEGATAARPA